MFLKILGYKLIRNVFYIMLLDTIFIQLWCWFSFPFSFYREIWTQNLYINVQAHFFINKKKNEIVEHFSDLLFSFFYLIILSIMYSLFEFPLFFHILDSFFYIKKKKCIPWIIFLLTCKNFMFLFFGVRLCDQLPYNDYFSFFL